MLTRIRAPKNNKIKPKFGSHWSLLRTPYSGSSLPPISTSNKIIQNLPSNHLNFDARMAYNLNNNATMDPQTAVEKVVSVIGFGYDLTSDIRLSACKVGPKGSGLIELAQTQIKDSVVPGGVVVRGVSASIKCDKGERTRFCSDALSFNQIIHSSFLSFF